MSDTEKLVIYETFFEDLYHAFQERYEELHQKFNSLGEFDQGKHLAYYELLDAMKTRNEMISELLD